MDIQNYIDRWVNLTKKFIDKTKKIYKFIWHFWRMKFWKMNKTSSTDIWVFLSSESYKQKGCFDKKKHSNDSGTDLKRSKFITNTNFA